MGISNAIFKTYFVLDGFHVAMDITWYKYIRIRGETLVAVYRFRDIFT